MRRGLNEFDFSVLDSENMFFSFSRLTFANDLLICTKAKKILPFLIVYILEIVNIPTIGANYRRDLLPLLNPLSMSLRETEMNLANFFRMKTNLDTNIIGLGFGEQ